MSGPFGPGSSVPSPRGAVAQLVAHLHGMEGVRGSNPLSSTKFLQIRSSISSLADDGCQAWGAIVGAKLLASGMAGASRRGYGEDGIYCDHRGDCRDAHHKTCSSPPDWHHAAAAETGNKRTGRYRPGSGPDHAPRSPDGGGADRLSVNHAPIVTEMPPCRQPHTRRDRRYRSARLGCTKPKGSSNTHKAVIVSGLCGCCSGL
jgi:hypothetical protein